MKISIFNLLSIIIVFSACNTNDKNDAYFKNINQNDSAIAVLSNSDWLVNHKEKGQSLESFIESKFNSPTPQKNIIYIRPIGVFNNFQYQQINLCREYIEHFFQLKTIILDTISSSVVPQKFQRYSGYNYGEDQQLHAGYIIDSVLPKQVPQDAIALMAITAKDIYPRDDWNYVFGLGSYRNRVGVTSLFRFNESEINNENINIGFLRLIKVSTHELGHMFGLKHCINANCLMNGSNGMDEVDIHPSRLCSLCQQKIHHNFKYDNYKRLNELIKFFKQNKIVSEYQLLMKDVK